MLSRSVRTGLVGKVLLLHCNSTTTTPNTAIFGCVKSSNVRYFSSDDKSAPEPSYAAKNGINSVVKNFSFSNIVQEWKNKCLREEEKESSPVVMQKEESSSVDAVENTSPPSAIDLALNSVVKVFTVSSEPRLCQPWQISEQEECYGSGFVIAGRKIITNAHVVDNHTSVKVRKHGSKYKAKVRAIGHECDLAILEIDSDEFWEGMNFLELGDIPSLRDAVAVVGYPCGGDSISVTTGVVSRVEPRKYSHSSTELLAVQIDAAINPGNSGGPVMMGNKVAGVAFQSMCWYESLNYIIPTPVIKHFLNGVKESGQPVIFCSMDLSYQPMENSDDRNYFNMSKEMTGILVNRINPLSYAQKFLKKNDVILAIDGVPIANDSTVHFRKQERINFKHMVSMKKPSETALFKVLREGKEYEFNISLKPVQRLVPMHHFDKIRSYYIFGGLVFVPLSQPYINETWMSQSHSKKMAKKPGEQIVIISQILEDDINAGRSAFENFQVKKVNGVEVDNLKHLCQLIEECSTAYLVLDLEKDKFIALNYSSAKKVTTKIMKELKIPSAMSDDLRPKQRKSGRTRIAPRPSKKN